MIFKKRIGLPSPEEAVYVARNMKLLEKMAFLAFTVVFIISFLSILWKVNNLFLAEIPANKGMITEGIIGTPRFINPTLAISDADRDMTELVYSGLMRADNKGELIPALAENFSISDDGLTYTFKLKPGLIWQDGNPLTSDDIVFTVEKIKDPAVKSPKRGSWEGVSAEKIDETSARFILKKPYASFLENTTIGILPKHVWSNVPADQVFSSNLNIIPLGSGPYQVNKINRSSGGIITSYELTANKKFALGTPYIQKITLRFYSSENELINAYLQGEIDNISAVTPQLLEKIKKNNHTVKTLSLPRAFGVFFNQNSANIFTQKEIRQVLNMSTNRAKIIKEVLRGFGTELFHPLPRGTLATAEEQSIVAVPTGRQASIFSIAEARAILEKNGWKMNEKEGVLEKKIKKEVFRFSFSISTADTPELKQTAELLKETWEAIGAKVDIKIFETGDLNQNVIRPRKYDSLLFGQIAGRDPDPFVFWHSSQRNDPGLNIALYASIKTDKILEEIRAMWNSENRRKKYQEFQEEVANDIPAVFLFSPKFIYLMPNDLKGVEQMQSIAAPSERFSTVYNWYRETDKVWKIFLPAGRQAPTN